MQLYKRTQSPTRIVCDVWSRSLSFEGNSNAGPYLFHLDFSVILLHSRFDFCAIYFTTKTLYIIVHPSLENLKNILSSRP